MTDTITTEIECVDVDVSQIMQARAAMYGLLARVYIKEVDEQFLAELKAMTYPQNSDNPQINDAFKTIYSYMRHLREDSLDQLSIDYNRTFIGSGILNGNAAFPYESVYTSEHALVMQEARDEVLALYKSEGITKRAEWTDPEDHISLELEFMQTLAQRTYDALTSDDPSADDQAQALIVTQYHFLTDHLLRWVSRFLLDVTRFCTTSFYEGFAQLTEAYLTDDKLLLEDIIEASAISFEE